MALKKVHIFSTAEFGGAKENESVIHVEFIGVDFYLADPYRREDGKERTVLVSCEALGIDRGCVDEKLVLDPVFTPQVEIPLSSISSWQIVLPETVDTILKQVAMLAPLIERAAGSSATVEEKIACLNGLREAVEQNKFLLPFLKQIRHPTVPHG